MPSDADATWRSYLRGDPLPWLLDESNPSARYLTLTELLERRPDDPEVTAARAAIPLALPARAILEAQYPPAPNSRQPGGYWIKPDVGYSPKYRATVWQIMFLAQLGAPPIEAIRCACQYVLDHSRVVIDRHGRPDGRFVDGKGPHAATNCLNGNLIWALRRFGYGEDPRLLEAQAGMVSAIAQRGFGCHFNGGLDCAWGAIKVLRACLEIPTADRQPAVQLTIERGVTLLLSVPLLQASYPSPYGVSPAWFALSFPLTCSADLLEALEVLTKAGESSHPYVQAGRQWLLERQDSAGRWKLERTPGKMWSSCGRLGEPNPWVTLRALSWLKASLSAQPGSVESLTPGVGQQVECQNAQGNGQARCAGNPGGVAQ